MSNSSSRKGKVGVFRGLYDPMLCYTVHSPATGQRVNTIINIKDGQCTKSSTEQLMKLVAENSDFINALYPVS